MTTSSGDANKAVDLMKFIRIGPTAEDKTSLVDGLAGVRVIDNGVNADTNVVKNSLGRVKK